MLIDLSAVRFLDSPGQAALVASRPYADLVAKTVQITGARGHIAEAIEATGLTDYLCGPRHTV